MSQAARSPSQKMAIYARYSSENQRDASIEDQVRICRARASQEGWEVWAVYTDHAVSGSTQLRPGYQSLLAAMRMGQVGVVLTESLDRLSRDQEHIAGFHKEAKFADVRIVTLAEGEISELHVGLKGTMGALYLKDLADKTRRGLEGRVRQGRSGGGLCYGYRVIRGAADHNGEHERGLREIDEAQAAIVRRIFEEFVAGDGPITITKRLNAERIPGPRGGVWTDGALRGQAKAGTGILRNALYVGELVWNRRRWLKDPSNGRRVARYNGEGQRVTEQVPELRIVSEALWTQVQRRLAAAARPQTKTGEHADHLWQHRRAPNLLSGKVFCGCCSGTYITSGKDYMACKAAAKQGTCINQARVRRSRLEVQVLQSLGHELMQPEAVAAFIESFTEEWNLLSAEMSAQSDLKQRELAGVSRKLNGLIDAIVDGLRAPDLQQRLDDLGARKATLEAEIAKVSMSATAPVLHPALAEMYRARLARLRETLESEGCREALEAARALIDRVEISPPTDGEPGPRIELIGHLTALLRAAGVGGMPLDDNAKSPPELTDGLVLFLRSQSGDAGTGFEPVTFRL